MKRRSSIVVLAVSAALAATCPASAGVTFADAVNYSMGMASVLPVSVAMADFNLDGHLDWAVAGTNGQLQVRLNNGSGTYPSIAQQLFVDSPYEIASSDVNLDGRPDLVVGNVSAGIMQVTTFLGNGNGTFQMPAPTNIVTNCGCAVDIAIDDVNLDGRPDVLVTSQGVHSMYVLLGTGTAAFSLGPEVPLTGAANDVAITKLNGDTLPDAVVIDLAGVKSLIGFGDGNFSTYGAWMVEPWPASVKAGDYNADGKNDVVAGNFASNGAFQVTLLPGNGDGTFGMPWSAAAGLGMYGGAEVVAGDIDGDMRLDVAVVNSSLNELRVLFGKGNLTLGPAQGFATQAIEATSLALADLDSDGRLDAVVTNRGSDQVSVFLQGMPPPTAPLNVTVARGYRELTLNWSPPASADATGYRIYRGTSPGMESYLTAVGNVLSWTDTGLGDGATYYYVVTATNGAGEGPPSNDTFATTFTIPGPPSNVMAVPGSAIGDVDISWGTPTDDGGTPMTSYLVCRRTESAGPRFCVNVGDATTFTDEGNQPLHTYFYEVSAINMVGHGPDAPQVCSKPFPWLAQLGC